MIGDKSFLEGLFSAINGSPVVELDAFANRLDIPAAVCGVLGIGRKLFRVESDDRMVHVNHFYEVVVGFYNECSCMLNVLRWKLGIPDRCPFKVIGFDGCGILWKDNSCSVDMFGFRSIVFYDPEVTFSLCRLTDGACVFFVARDGEVRELLALRRRMEGPNQIVEFCRAGPVRVGSESVSEYGVVRGSIGPEGANCEISFSGYLNIDNPFDNNVTV